jgi:hypothetical protein
MSFFPTKEFELYQDAKSTAIEAKEISTQFATLNDVPDYKKRDDYLVYIKGDDTYYRWDEVGQVWDIAINPNGGGIVDTITTNEPNLLKIDNTDPNNIIIDPQMGFGEAPKYIMSNNANAGNFGKIATDNNANFTTATTLTVNHKAENRYEDDEYVRNYLQNVIVESLPMKFYLNNPLNGNIAEFFITSLNSTTAQHTTFNCVFDTVNSTVTTFANDTLLIVFIGQPHINYSNTDGNLTFANTNTFNRTINFNSDTIRRLGAYRPFDYIFNSPATTGNHISANSGNATVISSMSIGFEPVNRGLNEIDYVRDIMDKLRARLPFKIRILNVASGLYASYNATAYNSMGAVNYSFTVSYIASESNMVGGPSNFVNGNRLFVYLEEFVPRTASEMTANAQSILTTTNLQTQLTTVNTRLSLVNKATVNDSSIQVLSHTGSLASQGGAWNVQANGDFAIYMSLSDGWLRTVFMTPNVNIKAIRNNTAATNRSRFLAVRLIGTAWNRTNGLSDVAIGFTTDRTMQSITNWATSNQILNFEGIWNINEKLIRGRFLGAGVQFNYGTSNTGSISGSVLNDNSVVNDVLIFRLGAEGVFYLEHRTPPNYNVVVKTGTIVHPDGINFLNNFNCDNIIPVISPNFNNSLATLEIMGKRTTDSLGITNVSDAENIFW